MAVILATLGLATSSADAFSCAPPYAVDYVAPTWLVTWKGGQFGPLSQLWYRDPWNNSVVPIGPHIGSNATSAERVTFHDWDRDVNLSRSDVFQIWDENATLDAFLIGIGPNGTAQYGMAAFTLQPGYESRCVTPPFWWVDPLSLVLAIVLGIAFVAAIVVLVVLFFLRSSKK